MIKAHISAHNNRSYVDISVNGNYWQLNDSKKNTSSVNSQIAFLL